MQTAESVGVSARIRYMDKDYTQGAFLDTCLFYVLRKTVGVQMYPLDAQNDLSGLFTGFEMEAGMTGHSEAYAFIPDPSNERFGHQIIQLERGVELQSQLEKIEGWVMAVYLRMVRSSYDKHINGIVVDRSLK